MESDEPLMMIKSFLSKSYIYTKFVNLAQAMKKSDSDRRKQAVIEGCNSLVQKNTFIKVQLINQFYLACKSHDVTLQS